MSPAAYENTFGALLVGLLFASFLFGIVNIQVHHYFSTFPNDRTVFKLMVSFVWLLELAHTVGTAHEVYTRTILHIFSTHKPITLPGTFVAAIMGAFITLTAQVYLSIRIYHALRTPKGLIGLFVGIAAVARCTGAMFLVVEIFGSDNYHKSISKSTHFVTGLLAMSAGIDIIIAATTLYYLFDPKRGNASIVRCALDIPFNLFCPDVGFKRGRVQRLVDIVIILIIRSGLLTSVIAVTVLVAFQFNAHTFAWLAIWTCSPKIYTITFLLALNDRGGLRQGTANNLKNNKLFLFGRHRSMGELNLTQLPSQSKRNRPVPLRYRDPTKMVEKYAKTHNPPPPDPDIFTIAGVEGSTN